jgi:hypothetical protein
MRLVNTRQATDRATFTQALQMGLARMLSLVLRKEGGRTRTVLVATSGDTGSAVAHGVLQERLGLKDVGVFLAPAHPAKFREVLERDMNLSVELPPANF